MALPIRVNLRGLFVRRSATLLTIAGVGLMTATFAIAWSLDAGLKRSLSVGSDPALLVVLRKGANAESNSGIAREDVPIMTSAAGVDAGPSGPLASAEHLVIINLPRRGAPDESANVIVRGVPPVGPELRSGFRIVEGRMLAPGAGEAVVARGLAGRFSGLGLGEELVMRKRPFRVVGLFEVPGTPYDSEVWTDATELGETHGREDSFTSVLLRVGDPLARVRVEQELENDEWLAVDVEPQPEYFATVADAGTMLPVLSTLITLFLTIGACFAAANTMHASVLARTREIGTLRALGFRRWAILASYMAESVLLALVSGVFGLALAALVLAVQGGRAGTSNWQTFSEVTFELAITPSVVTVVLVLSAFIGLVGGFLPALRAARMPIVEALRAA